MKSSDNIEKLFKDTFENFEADVNPAAWTNVQSGMNAASGSAASAGTVFTAGKIIVGALSVALVSGTVWYLAVSGDPTVPSAEKQQTAETVSGSQQESSPVVIAKEQSPAKKLITTPDPAIPAIGSEWQTPPPAARTLNQYSSGANYPQQARIVPIASDNAVYSDVSELESSSKPAHKYGNATQGDGGMTRGVTYAPANTNSHGSNAEPEETDPGAPAVAIMVSSSSGDAPLTVDFISQGNASSLTWDFDDGSSSKESAPSHTFDKPGTYVVKVTAKNSRGTSSDKVTIEVKAVSFIKDVPTIFTPNGDGVNDVFFFDMKNISSIGVAIYSQRTGELIAKWNNLDGNWNGKLKSGADAPAGIYLYSIQAIGTDGIPHSEKGFVTIAR